jgi:hypothetical protein
MSESTRTRCAVFKAMLAKRMTVHEEAIVATWESSNG